MAAWVRFLPEGELAGPRMYVCWAGPASFESQQPVSGGAIGAAFAAALERNPAGFVSVDWDIAYDGFDRAAMEAAIAGDPERPQAALYPIWPAATWRDSYGYGGADAPQGAVSIGSVSAPGGYRKPEPGDSLLDGFSFGLTWLPGGLLKQARADGLLERLRFPDADSVWSGWCVQRGIQAGIVWDCRPKHLHFDAA